MLSIWLTSCKISVLLDRLRRILVLQLGNEHLEEVLGAQVGQAVGVVRNWTCRTRRTEARQKWT